MPSTWEVQLAKHFKDRDNVEPVGVTLGDVISVNPLSISIYNNQVILTEQHCCVCSSLKTIENILNTGDKVLCLPTTDGQTFFIVDKVVV